MKCSLGIPNFLEISSLSHSIVFLYFFALITEEGFLSLLTIFWNSAFRSIYFSFSPLPFTSHFSAIWKASSDNHFAFVHFFFLGMVLITASCTMSWILSLVLQALYQVHQVNLNGLVVFPTFSNLRLNLTIRSSWPEPQSAPGRVFADCIELVHLWLQRI